MLRAWFSHWSVRLLKAEKIGLSFNSQIVPGRNWLCRWLKCNCQTFAHSRRNTEPCRFVLSILHGDEELWHLKHFLHTAHHHCPDVVFHCSSASQPWKITILGTIWQAIKVQLMSPAKYCVGSRTGRGDHEDAEVAGSGCCCLSLLWKLLKFSYKCPCMLSYISRAGGAGVTQRGGHQPQPFSNPWSALKQRGLIPLGCSPC